MSKVPPDIATPPSRRGAVIGLIVIVALVLGALLLVHALERMSEIQDCAMSGRSNCAPIDAPRDAGSP
jgi:hypothetical protein